MRSIEDTNNVGESFVSPFVQPLKYRLELTPIIEVNVVSRLKGHLVIEFQVNDTTGLNKLSLSAKNITVANCRLSLLDPGEDKRRLKRDEGETNYDGRQNDVTTGNVFNFDSNMQYCIFAVNS